MVDDIPLSLPDITQVIDACVLTNTPPPNRTGISDARFPDGSSQWDFARTPTRGAANQIDVETGIVINEIMYDPFKSRMTNGGIVDERPGKYIELYNRSTVPVDLIEVRKPGPRGASGWEPLAERAGRTEQLDLLGGP
jgi:hypothetical protein